MGKASTWPHGMCFLKTTMSLTTTPTTRNDQYQLIRSKRQIHRRERLENLSRYNYDAIHDKLTTIKITYGY